MKISRGEVVIGPRGTATQVVITGPIEPPDWEATVATWFFDCPGQSPAWRHYVASIIHLRDIPGVRPAQVKVPHATHEVMLFALDEAEQPTAMNPRSWVMLHPANVCEQIELPSDEDAAVLLAQCAKAVVEGILPAEPMLAGAREPWLTVLLKTAAHHRGEPHAS